MSIIRLDWSRITLTDSEGEVLLYGNITDGDATTYRRAVRDWTYQSYLCSGATTIQVICSQSKINRLYEGRAIKFGDTSANQILRIYLHDIDTENSEYLAFEGKILGTVTERNMITLSASSEALVISQNKKEFDYSTDGEGYISVSALMLHLIQNAGSKEDTGDGVTLQTDSVIANDARFYASEYFPNETIWQAHGQVLSELLDHLIQMSGGYQNSDGSYNPPIVYFPSESNKDLVRLRSFGCGLDSAISPVEISQLNGAIVGDITIDYANREDVINRVYFYRARPATYNDEGELIDPGNPNELTECHYEPDTINRYGSRSVYLSYPEFIDKHEGGTSALKMMGRGICRWQNDPQDVVSVICDYSVLLSLTNCILNGTFAVNDTRSKGNLGDYVCIGYTIKGSSLQATLELAQKSPYKSENLADNLSVTEQRVSALEAKTANLDNTLVMKIGTASLSAVEADCNKHWANRSFSGINNLKCGTTTPNADEKYNLGAPSYRWNDLYVTTVKAAKMQISGDAAIGGTIAMDGHTVATQNWVQDNTLKMSNLENINVNVEPYLDNQCDLGAPSYRWSRLYVTEVNAESVYCSSGGGLKKSKSWADTNATEWPCKSAVQTALDTLGKISHSTGPQNTSWKTGGVGYMVFTSSGAIRFKIMWGRKDYASGIAQQIISFPISFNYPPVVVAWQVRDSSKEMGDARAPHNVSKEGFTMYSDSSAVNWVAMGI